MNEKQILKKYIKNIKLDIKWDYERIELVKKKMEESLDYIKSLDEEIKANKLRLKIMEKALEELK